MNSVAIPASSPSQVLNSEGDLARSAARGDAEAFAELFRRHAQPAWRLAQAVAADREGAAAAFRDGFSRAVRSRKAAAAGSALRPEILAAVYKVAVERALDQSATPSVARRAPDADSALADAAFRSLPERWRAAVWLSDVEGMDVDRIAPILGVSSAVAGQLVTRGRRGLAGRFAQARHDVPEHLGDVLRAAAMAMPANLAQSTRARWAAVGNQRTPLFAPVGAWMEDHAVRPISVAVGALVGLGLIGLGVVPQGSPVRSQLGAGGAGSLAGAVPVQTCLGLPCTGNGTGGGAPGGSGAVLTALGGGNPFGTASLTASSGGTGGLGSGASSPAGSGSGGGAGPTGSGSSGSGLPGSGPTGGSSGGGGSGGGGTGGGGGGGSPLPSPTTTLPPTVNLAPVATVSNTGSSLNVTLLPSSPASTTVTVPTSLTPSSTTATTTAPSTTTTTTPLSGVTSTVTTVAGTLQGVTNTVTSTATTLLPGL